MNNERKDNEIIILRQENGILKKEIEKHEMNNIKYESKIKSEQETIQELTKQISLLNKKVSKLELVTSQKENNIIPQNNNNSSSINININNNGNSSSKWIIKQENQDSHNNYNSNNINSNIGSNPNINSFTNYRKKTRKINNFTKNNAKYTISNSNNNNLNIGKRYTRFSNGNTGFQTKNHKNVGMNTIDNNNNFTNTYKQILNNLCVKDIKEIESPNKKLNKTKKIKKNNSISMYIEEYDKSVMENKCIVNKGKRYNSTRKNNSNEYNKIIGFASNNRYPLSNKHQISKNNNTHSVPKKNLIKDKNSASYSSLILKRK